MSISASRIFDPAAPSASKGTVPIVSLVVTITNADGSGNAYRIMNDGQGSYTNGSQGVEAILDQYGTFAFDTFVSGRVAARWVTYDFSSPVDSTNTYRPTPSNSMNYHFSSGAASNVPFVPIQNLGVNGNPATECMYMGNSFANSTTSWRVSFHKGFEDVPNGPTAYAVVTRTSVSPATWTITPAGSCSPNANVAALRSGDGSVIYGYYNLPFLFTLTAQ
jgi:hypothetical protein